MTSVHQSAKMRDAQAYFQQVVKHELQVLLRRGMERQAAVKQLLHRIVASTETPEDGDVLRVMRQFEMNHEDAVRALIVKQEIGRLKRQGLDAFAAIEELTRKMKMQSEEEQEENDTEAEGEGSATQQGAETTRQEECPVNETAAVLSCMDIDARPRAREDMDVEAVRERSASETSDNSGGSDSAAVVDDEDAETAVDTAAVDAGASPMEASSMALCARIDSVSISTLSTTSRLDSESPWRQSNSRKRRAQRPASPSPSPERELQGVSPPVSRMEREEDDTALLSDQEQAHPQDDADNEHTDFSHKRKKQRLWDRVQDSFATALSLKNTVVAPASPTAVSAHDDDSPPPRTARGKRPRNSSSPLDLMALDDARFHVPKRHKR